MQCEYKKTTKKSGLVLWEESVEEGPGFYEMMFAYNQIPGILPFVTERLGGKLRYRYDTGAGESVKERFGRIPMGYDQFRDLLCKITDIMETASEYLLDERDYVLLPECIIYNAGTEKIALCYYPMLQKGSEEQWAELLEFLLAHIDYRDMSVVTALYELYMRSKSAGFGPDTVKKIIGYDAEAEEQKEQVSMTVTEKTDVPETEPVYCLQAERREESVFITHFPFCVEPDPGEEQKTCVWLSMRGESFYIEDMKSENGTFVNGRRIGRNEIRKLNIGDSVMLADRSYRFIRID